jgi:extracellular elastinolytic metalloproteinase
MRRRVAALSVAALAVAGLSAIAPGAVGQGNPHAIEAATRVHWANGKALGAQQYAGGLRVVDSDVKAALKGGRPVSVIENASAVGTPAAARISADDAKRAAVDSIYAGRAVRFLQAPSAERVAVPMSNGKLAEGFAVTTWDAANQLRETIVDGNGAVVRSELRTASDSYNIFGEDPDKSTQTVVAGPAPGGASPFGWLSGAQTTVNITGNNAHAYLDHDANNKPDSGGTAVTDGNFLASFDPNTQPSAGANQAVAVQNLFYLNNLIHDTLYNAGFTAGAGNFQEDNAGLGGRDGDPVLAEAQDGSGTDNANFATPNDGRSGRMQMYLWSVPGTSEVVQNGTSYNAPVAEFSAPLTVAGVTGPLAVASVADACTAIAPVAAGTIVIADRGTCPFVDKASNIKSAGGAGVIIANNNPSAPFVMGGTLHHLPLPAVMVSHADGAALKAAAPASTTIRLVDPAPPMKDGDLDTDIVWHEYGHGLTWRMIGNMDGPVAGGIGEGMSDVLSEVVNDDPILGEYSVSDPTGIRSHSYADYASYRTYADVPFTEVHDTGELYGAIGWELWTRYKGAGLGQSDILSDLVQGMNFTPSQPSFEEMRSGILAGLTAFGHDSRACMVWNAFATLGVGVGSSATVSHRGVATVN